MGLALVSNNFSPVPSKFSFHMKKKSDLLLPENYKALKPCWLLNWVSITRVVACFLKQAGCGQQQLQLTQKRLVFCSRPPDQRKQIRRSAPTWRAWQLILPSKHPITFWNSLQRDCQMTSRGSNLDSNSGLNSATWPTSCKGFTASEIIA